MNEQEIRDAMKALTDEGGMSQDEAAHMLADMGEIDSTLHAELLTPTERKRVYGD